MNGENSVDLASNSKRSFEEDTVTSPQETFESFGSFLSCTVDSDEPSKIFKGLSVLSSISVSDGIIDEFINENFCNRLCTLFNPSIQNEEVSSEALSAISNLSQQSNLFAKLVASHEVIQKNFILDAENEESMHDSWLFKNFGFDKFRSAEKSLNVAQKLLMLYPYLILEAGDALNKQYLESVAVIFSNIFSASSALIQEEFVSCAIENLFFIISESDEALEILLNHKRLSSALENLKPEQLPKIIQLGAWILKMALTASSQKISTSFKQCAVEKLQDVLKSDSFSGEQTLRMLHFFIEKLLQPSSPLDAMDVEEDFCDNLVPFTSESGDVSAFEEEFLYALFLAACDSSETFFCANNSSCAYISSFCDLISALFVALGQKAQAAGEKAVKTVESLLKFCETQVGTASDDLICSCVQTIRSAVLLGKIFPKNISHNSLVFFCTQITSKNNSDALSVLVSFASLPLSTAAIDGQSSDALIADVLDQAVVKIVQEDLQTSFNSNEQVRFACEVANGVFDFFGDDTKNELFFASSLPKSLPALLKRFNENFTSKSKRSYTAKYAPETVEFALETKINLKDFVKYMGIE